MPRPTMLKAVLQRNSSKMDRIPSVPSHLITVKMLAEKLRILDPTVNLITLNNLIALLDEINGGPVRTVGMNGDLIDVRLMIQGSMTALIRSVEEERPRYSARLTAIDWITLFGVESMPVTVNVTAPSDEDSGGGSMRSELGD